MIYFLRPHGDTQFDTATAEGEATAQRLEGRGFERVLYEPWRDAREENDKRDGQRIAKEARPASPAPEPPEPGTAIGELVGGRKIHKGDK